MSANQFMLLYTEVGGIQPICRLLFCNRLYSLYSLYILYNLYILYYRRLPAENVATPTTRSMWPPMLREAVYHQLNSLTTPLLYI